MFLYSSAAHIFSPTEIQVASLLDSFLGLLVDSGVSFFFFAIMFKLEHKMRLILLYKVYSALKYNLDYIRYQIIV
jgi:hypothetical protein